MGVVGLGALVAPVAADTIPLVPAVSAPVVGLADSSLLAPLDSITEPIADLAGSFAALPDEGELAALPDAPIEGSILLTIGLGGASGSTGLLGETGSGASDINISVPESKGDPAGLPVPLPGAGLMGMAGLAGVVVLSGRRRR